MSEPDNNRKDILLRAAFDLLRRSDLSAYVRHAPNILIRYDEANCDGSCLMEDIANELGFDCDTQPIPLGEEDE